MSRRIKIIIFSLTLMNLILGLNANNISHNELTSVEKRFNHLPETLVEYGKYSISKKDAFKILLDKNAKLDTLSDFEILDMLKLAIDEKIYLDITTFYLDKNGFSPSYQMAYNYLNESISKLPTELIKVHLQNKNIETLANDKNYQLTVATLFYLKKNYPDKTKVTKDEIEFFYRINQNSFIYDAKMDLSFIGVEIINPESKLKIDRAYSLLKQGVNFDKLAEEYNQKLTAKFYSPKFQSQLISKANSLKISNYSEILEIDNTYVILKLKDKELPKYIPLEQASFFIQSTIESRKCAKELESILENALNKIEIKYFF